MGIKYSSTESDAHAHELLEDLTSTVACAMSEMGSAYDGLLILIDEADKPSASANLGEFAKLFTEKLTKRGCNRVSIGLSGISSVLQKLKESHESSLRVFEILTLDPLLADERTSVIHKGLAQAKEKNGFEVSIIQAAEDWISRFSEGYPHFIQQFAYSAFNTDSDNVIDVEDVIKGAFAENGAFQQLGLKYFHDLYFDQIASDEYREVLRAMSKMGNDWVSKEEIRRNAKLKSATLNNAITALKKRRIIIPQQGKKGMYRLPTKSFAVWINAFTQARVAPAEPLQEEPEARKKDEAIP